MDKASRRLQWRCFTIINLGCITLSKEKNHTGSMSHPQTSITRDPSRSVAFRWTWL